jgi:hypothetical protein
MNNLLFCLIIIALVYYFIYLPSQKKALTHEKASQTEPTNLDLDLLKALDSLIKNVQDLNQQLN